jgi:hypothetical protein
MPIDEKDIARLREIFVTRQECQAQTDSFESKLNKDLVRLAVIETKLSQITWILSTVAAGVVTMLIKMFFGS